MNTTWGTSYIAAIDIGGTKIAATIADASGPLTRVTQPTVKTGSSQALPEQVIQLISEACRCAGVERERVRQVGISSCGPFVRTAERGIGLATPNICGGYARSADLPNDWQIIPLEDVLREQFDTIKIENDCVAALVAERTFGAVQNELNCVYATWSTGIGFGLCVDGHILHGKNGNAGHAGHMLMNEDQGALCGCGNRGDLEGLISGRNLGNKVNMNAADLFQAARSGDDAARNAVTDAARWFGRALYNIATTLDTQVFVIGGSVWLHHGEWLTPIVVQEIKSRFPALTEHVRVLPAALGSLVTDIGALSLVIPREWIAPWRHARPWERVKELAI